MKGEYQKGYDRALYDHRMVGPDAYHDGWHEGYRAGYKSGLSAIEELEKQLKIYENLLEHIRKARNESVSQGDLPTATT